MYIIYIIHYYIHIHYVYWCWLCISHIITTAEDISDELTRAICHGIRAVVMEAITAGKTHSGQLTSSELSRHQLCYTSAATIVFDFTEWTAFVLALPGGS